MSYVNIWAQAANCELIEISTPEPLRNHRSPDSNLEPFQHSQTCILTGMISEPLSAEVIMPGMIYQGPVFFDSISPGLMLSRPSNS